MLPKWADNFFQKTFPRWEGALVVITFAYFFIQLCFFALSIDPYNPPDERERIELSLLFAKHGGFSVPDSPQTYHLGLVTHAPSLYFWLMGRLINFNFFEIPDFIFLRFVNILISMLTVIVFYKFLCIITDNKLTRVLAVITLTNTPMYAFLSAFVSYDNLTNLWAVMSLYFLMSFLKNRQGQDFLYLLLCGLLGTLTKITFIPLLAIFLFIIVLDKLHNRYYNLPWSWQWGRSKKNFVTIMVCCALLGVTLLNAFLYIPNLIRYKNLVPQCTQVLSEEQCSQHPNFRIYTELRKNLKDFPKEKLLKLHDYFFHWKNVFERGIFGIFGHRLFFRSSSELLPYNVLLLIFLGGLIRKFDMKDILTAYCLLTVAIYGGVIFYFANYLFKEVLKSDYAFHPAGLILHYGNMCMPQLKFP